MLTANAKHSLIRIYSEPLPGWLQLWCKCWYVHLSPYSFDVCIVFTGTSSCTVCPFGSYGTTGVLYCAHSSLQVWHCAWYMILKRCYWTEQYVTNICLTSGKPAPKPKWLEENCLGFSKGTRIYHCAERQRKKFAFKPQRKEKSPLQSIRMSHFSDQGYMRRNNIYHDILANYWSATVQVVPLE